MKQIHLLNKLSIQEKPRKKSKLEFKKEAQTLIKKYGKYSDDINYRFFLNDLVVGLSKDCEFNVINELIKDLQRLKKIEKKEYVFDALYF